MAQRTVTIDALPDSIDRVPTGYAVVCIDVIRATTTACTALAAGRRCLPVTSASAAFELQKQRPNSALVGELGGEMPEGFHINNSPSKLALLEDDRDVILLSSSGTQLMCHSRKCAASYVACLRNCAATARHIAAEHENVVVIGAGSGKDFRGEDQLCCAWIAGMLRDLAFAPANENTADLISRWSDAPLESITTGKSAAYLRRSHQLQDLDFILAHVNDLNAAYQITGAEIVNASELRIATSASD